MNRRQFVQRLLLGAAGPLGGLNLLSLANAASHSVSLPQRRLILVELAGANDGLSTLVPFRNDHYHTARPTLGLKRGDVLTLTDSMGMHQGLNPLMNLWEAGELAWIQGLGYPAANRSHFASIALWERAGDGRQRGKDSGWITHEIEHQLSRAVLDPHGISLVGDMDLFASDTGRWLSMRSTDQIDRNLLPSSKENLSTEHVALSLVQNRLSTLDSTLGRLMGKVEKAPEIPRFRGGQFGEQLRQVAKLVAAGVDTPVYRVRLSGFDTHQYQAGRHGQLMRRLGRALNDFSTSLKSLSEWNNTLVMTYSEFGRRVAENSSQGTDHGTAAPHVLLGGDVRGGLYSDEPSLRDLVEDDMQFTMDYRALYQRVVADGLGIDGKSEHLSPFQDSRLQRLIRAS